MRRASRVSRDSSDAMRCVFVTIRVFVYSCIRVLRMMNRGAVYRERHARVDSG